MAKAGSAPDAITIVDHGGYLIYFERMENTQLGAVETAIEKARSAALFRRPTKVFEDAVAGGRNALLALHGVVPIEGGVPIISGGKIVGAIGASGARVLTTLVYALRAKKLRYGVASLCIGGGMGIAMTLEAL